MKKIILCGAGHTHLYTLNRMKELVDRGCRVTVVNPGPYHYYSGMGPGLLSGIYRAGEVRFRVKEMTGRGGGEFVEDRAVKVLPGEKRLLLKSGRALSYDLISFNTGSVVPFSGLVDKTAAGIWPVKPIENIIKFKEAVLAAGRDRKLRLAVVGGGPAGVEIAGNARRLADDHGISARIVLIDGGTVLSGLPEKFQKNAVNSLSRRNIEIRIHCRVEKIADRSITFQSGEKIPFDFALLTIGITPSPIFGRSPIAVGEDGGLIVNRFLQTPDHPEIFGGGDCVFFRPSPLAKVGVYAVRENPVLFHNIAARLEGKELKPFQPQKDYLVIVNLGDGTGVLKKGSWVLGGKIPFLVKNYIDRSFMRKYQI